MAERHLNSDQDSSIHSLGIRRRLASFGGMSSPGSPSRYTAFHAYDNENGVQGAGVRGEMDGLIASTLGSAGSTSCLQSSPLGSGRSTPVSGLGSTQLLNVREQMVVALQKLRELEEQVKIIPLLKVKISVLQEEKEQLASQLQIQKKDSEGNGVEETAKGRRRSTTLEEEIQTQQQVIASLKQKTIHLEAELKESSLQAEMSRLKLELQAAEARNRVDKASTARPATASCSIQAGPTTTCQGVGNHTELKDASTGDRLEVKDVAVWCCSPESKNARVGPDLAMSRWEVRERVETKDKGEGVHVSTNSQGVGVEFQLRHAETNTDLPWPDLKKKELRSVACGECSVNVIVRLAKDTVSRGTVTESLKGVGLGPMASQRTNTFSSASRLANTRHAINSESSTNGVLRSQHKLTNTAKATAARTVSVGNRVKDVKSIPKTRTVGVETIPLEGNVPKPNTRDIGVGFTSIHENYLVGLKTQNMASGPSHLPDPEKTRSIGVGDGKIRDLSVSNGVLEGSNLVAVPRKPIRKENTEQGCSNTRKNMRFMRASSGLNPSHKLSIADNADEVDRSSNRKSREAEPMPARRLKSAVVACKGSKGSTKAPVTKRCKFSEKMMSACQALKTHLSEGKRLPSRELRDCLQTVQQEWFSVSSPKSASMESVEDYLSGFRVISPSLLRHVANMADGNGNTALHYSVSHSNFGVVQKLLDAGVCDAGKQNKAGYTPIMLAALAAVDRPEDMDVVERLFDGGDVNGKASQAGQTALMLAVSHGRLEMVRALLARGAAVNAQDDEGSTALMCASEHGHAAMVKLLLDQPECDAHLTDGDNSTALSIALEAGHNDIAVLLYEHANSS
ncbi:KN motif and ankyrin repeat domain-containing protein 1-like [Stigmatopora nigra]